MKTMKRVSVFALFLLTAVFAFGQKEIDEVKVTPPKFTGVTNLTSTMHDGKIGSIDDYLSKNINYPESDARNFKQGTEVIQFMVSTTGEISDFKIINEVSPKISEEVIRVLKTTNGMWAPGYKNEEIVAMENEVSVVFKIQDSKYSSDFKKRAASYFTKGGELFLTENKPQKALNFYDKAIMLLPNDQSLLLMRGLARYETGDTKGAVRDWERINRLGGTISDEYLSTLTGLKGYKELFLVIKK
jgi:tetratricopeptide (TPR) repeat protein